MPDPKFEGGGVTQRMRRARRERRSGHDAQGREGVREVPRGDQAAGDVRRGQARSSARRRSSTRAACASRASTCPDPQFDEDGGAQVRIGRGSGIDPDDPKFRAGAGGVPRQDAVRAPTDRRTSDEAPRRRRRRRGRARGGGRAARGRRRAAARAGADARRGRPRRSSGATSSTARTSPARSATPTPARWPRALAGTLTGAARAGHRRHPRPLAVRGRRRAGRVPALRRAAGLARLRARDDRRRGRPPARAQPARARPRSGHGRRRLGLGHDRGGQALPAARASSTRTARWPAARSCSGRARSRIGEAKADASATRPRPAARWPRSPRPSGA